MSADRIEVYANSKPADPAQLKVGDIVTIHLLDGTTVQSQVTARYYMDCRITLAPLVPGYVVEP